MKFVWQKLPEENVWGCYPFRIEASLNWYGVVSYVAFFVDWLGQIFLLHEKPVRTFDEAEDICMSFTFTLFRIGLPTLIEKLKIVSENGKEIYDEKVYVVMFDSGDNPQSDKS
jgi:hypothetical protein